jgi:hypothetical protein
LARQADTAPLRPDSGHRGEHQDDGGERSDGMHDDQHDRREDCARQEPQRVVGSDESGDWRRMAIVEIDEGAPERVLLEDSPHAGSKKGTVPMRGQSPDSP